LRRPRQAALCGTALGLAAALALGACSTLPHYGVATRTVTPHGNCDTSRIVPVGAALDLSGAAGTLGQEYLDGLKIAVDQVNHSRGLLHYHDCLQLLYKDTRGDGHLASKAILDLVNQEDVAFLVSPFLPSEIQAASRDLANPVVPTASFSSLGRTYDPHRYPKVFPLAASSGTVATTMTSFARSRGWTRIGVAGTGDVVGREGASDAIQAAKHAGMVLTGSAFLAPGVDGARSGLRRLQPFAPQAVLIMGDSPDVADALKARATLGWNVPVIAQDIVGDQSVLDAVGSGSLSGVFAVVPQAVVRQQTPLDPAVLALRDEVRSRPGVRQMIGSIIPYARAVDAVGMLGSVATGIHTVNPGPVRTYLENANFQGLLASYTFTSDAHTGMGSDQLTVASVNSLSDGLFGVARSG
jgi:ABC-type branched-subunit amino acid transport system substrate-binding protein